MILLIDNYDSFTYNLYQEIRKLGKECLVRRNDEITAREILRMRPRRIVISPGPGRPEEAGVTLEVIRTFGSDTPILGVCLGHQAIGLAYGGTVVRAKRLMHGKTCVVRHDGKDLPPPKAITAARYHSLVVEARAAGVDPVGAGGRIVVGVRHKFHPKGCNFIEPVATPLGGRLLRISSMAEFRTR